MDRNQRHVAPKKLLTFISRCYIFVSLSDRSLKEGMKWLNLSVQKRSYASINKPLLPTLTNGGGKVLIILLYILKIRVHASRIRISNSTD